MWIVSVSVDRKDGAIMDDNCETPESFVQHVSYSMALAPSSVSQTQMDAFANDRRSSTESSSTSSTVSTAATPYEGDDDLVVESIIPPDALPPSQESERMVSYLNRLSQLHPVKVEAEFEEIMLATECVGWKATIHMVAEGRASVHGEGKGSSKKVAKEAAATQLVFSLRGSTVNSTPPANIIHVSDKIMAARRRAEAQNAVLEEMAKLDDADFVLSIDIEMWEWAPHKIMLEVGIASVQGSWWTQARIRDHVEVHHFVIAENLHLRNGVFVPDNRDKFFFGQSTTMEETQVSHAVDEILRQGRAQGGKVFLVGHSIQGDRKWLEDVLGLEMSDLQEGDIAEAWKTRHGKDQKLKLSKMCAEYGMEMEAEFHNGANDAVYQLELCHRMVRAC